MCTSGIFLPSETSSELPPSFFQGQVVHSEAALASLNGSAPLAATMRLQPRYMTHMTIESFHEMYMLWCQGAAVPEDEIASSRCFREVYESTWKGKLRMRTVLEGYLLLEPDIANNSSAEVTVLLKAIDWAEEELARQGKSLPEHLILEDFVQVILENVKPARGRKLKAELLPGTLDFKSYVSQLGVEVAGLVNTYHDVADPNHCWRFIRRSDLPVYDDATDESWVPVEIPGEDYPHDASDCVLLVKHLVNSPSLSQSPLVLLPASFQKLLKKPLEALPRKLVADRARKEWEKFAPGPVKKVTVTQGNHADAVPKKRGRPRKKPEPVVGEKPEGEILNEPAKKAKTSRAAAIKAQGEGEIVFGPSSRKRGTVVPPAPADPCPIIGDGMGSNARDGMPPWPTRATFAGRKKPTDTESAKLFDSRREKFYQLAPSTLWRDGKERVYWKLCVEHESAEKGIEEFLKKENACPDASSHGPAASRGRVAGRGKGGGKCKAAKPNAKEPGRKRARGKASLKN
ncbi:Uncharacterized protein SCF082_LOCUS27352 [Durusdinium trenchii]|uniref:Uncharacterized protein n=1 Tax=Durusdinium trenchii TaxID=1381693 RepID=A0ABP0MGR2_9DINO